MKKILFLNILFFSLFAIQVQSQVTVTVGTGTVETQYNPVYTFYGYNYTQQIYTSAELNTAGAVAGMQINAIRFYWTGAGSLEDTDIWTVYIGETSQSSFTSTTNWVPFALLTEVYTGNITLPATAGWFTITLTTPVIWNGNNIVVAIDENVPSYGPSATRWRGTTTTDSKSIYYYSDSDNPNPASPPTAKGTPTTRPNIQFEMMSLTPCSGTPNPGTATISNDVGCPGATITLSSIDATVGSGVSYIWQSSPNADGPWTDIPNGTNLTCATNTNSITYYRLRIHCANSGLWGTSNVVSYTPEGEVCLCGEYPAVYANYTADEDISNVTVGSWSNSSNCSTIAPGPGSILNRYGNYTGTGGPIVMQGETVNFSLTQTSCGTYDYDNAFQLYIDWNMDGDFLDAGEQVYNQTTNTSGNHTKTGTFTVPATATTGTTRMRVVVVENSTPTTNYAHTSYSYGETEDYCITIIPAVECDGAPSAGTATISTDVGCPGQTFTLSSTDATLASGITYLWQSSPNPDGPWTDIPAPNGTNLYCSTNATSITYYRLRVHCANSGLWTTSNVVSYTPEGEVCLCGEYPAVYASYTSDEDISNITIGSWSNNSNCSTIAPGPGSILNRYGNYTGTGGPVVMQGETVNFSLTQTSCGTYDYGNGFQLYIDWNMDGDFLDADEQVYNQPTAASGNHTKTGTFIVPITATPGTTRMRAVVAETTFPTSTNYAHTSYNYGETEDYCITIVPAVDCDGMPTAGTATPASQIVPSGNSATITLSGYTIAAGLSFQWQRATSSSGPFTDIVGATSLSYTTEPLTTSYYYRCIVTCVATGDTSTSTIAFVEVVESFNMSNTTITTCDALFYDSGGSTSPYSSYENLILTIMPELVGGKVIVTFNSFNTENNYDKLYIYNGNSTTAPLIGEYTGSTSPGTVTSTATDGSLTFRFNSDSGVQYAGWEATVSCSDPCNYVYEAPIFDQVGPYCADWAIPDLPTTSNNGYSGTWSPAINNTATTIYTFTPNVGECATTTTMTIAITPNNPASFTQYSSYCRGDSIPELPTTSDDNIEGTWSPAINNWNTTEYIFVTNDGTCAWTSMVIEVDTVPAEIINNSGSNELTCDLT
ncbi:MAG TPA: GEVED domain-containing protein, partial [Bacteroidales bacterium]|nr:GEVED domain-containing protein [Bacteroidales bacterium]